MAEEFSGLGSKVFLFNPESGRITEHDLETHDVRVVRKSDNERRIDRIMATPPSEMIVPQGDGSFVLFGKPKPFTIPASIKPHEEPIEFVENTDHWFRGSPPSGGFSFTGTCELADGAEAEELRDMMLRDMPETKWEVDVLALLHGECVCDKLPRKILKAMTNGGYYKRNTKGKRKAGSYAMRLRCRRHSQYICNAKMKIEENGEVLILGRGVSKTQVLKQHRSKSLC